MERRAPLHRGDQTTATICACNCGATDLHSIRDRPSTLVPPLYRPLPVAVSPFLQLYTAQFPRNVASEHFIRSLFIIIIVVVITIAKFGKENLVRNKIGKKEREKEKDTRVS